VTTVLCGEKRCPKGGEHSWDGPGIEWTHPCATCNGTGTVDDLADPIGGVIECVCPRCKGDGKGGGGGAATCSKCGLDALSHTMMTEEDRTKTAWDRINDPEL